MQVQASGVTEKMRVTAFLDGKITQEEKSAEIEKVREKPQGHSGVRKTGVEKTIGLYQGETAVQDAASKRVAEIKDKLMKLVNQSSGMELFGMKQEGYSLNAADVEKIETVIDQIQVKLAAYCDSYVPPLQVDSDVAEEILGDAALAGNITQRFHEYGVVPTEDNIKEAGEAVAMAQAVEAPSRTEAGYMAASGMEPTIENLYQTEHTPVPEQGSEPLSESDWEQLKSQAEKLLSEAGIEPNEDNLDTARWMIEQGIPMSKEMLCAFSNILTVDGEMSTDEIVDTIAQAMAKGKEAREALLTGEGYTQERVEAVLDRVEKETAADLTAEGTTGIEELTRRRRMEEIRLMMTTEAGFALLKKGIEIDTLSLSELVDALKEQEKEYYKALYQYDGLEASPEKLAEVQDVNYTVEALKEMPSYVVGMMYQSQEEVTAAATYEAGLPLKAVLDAAHTTYDALMTAPDREYGDSLTKAFGNIDELLADMDRETTPENRRVIKILAYNQMELNDQNMDAVTELDREYQYLLKNLTPRVTMHMIEKHINPLKTEIHELNDQIEAIKEEIGPEKAETYSEFLWKLEKQTDLAKEDRDAYIGLYRLLNQVDRTGEAAIGALVNQNQDVTLDNLLSAVRSRRARGINVSVNDEFGFLTNIIPKGTSISDQLKGFMETMQQDDGSYEEEQKRQMQNLAKEAETIRLLTQTEEPVSLDNLQAAHHIAYEEMTFLQRVQELGRKQDKHQEKSWQNRLESKEAMQEGYKELEGVAEELVAEAMENVDNGRETIEELRLLCRTVALAGRLASFEDYHMPVEIEGETCAVHVRLIHNADEAGRAEVSMEIPNQGKLRADFRLGEESTTAFIMADSPELLETARMAGHEFAGAMADSGFPELELTYADGRRLPPVTDDRTNNTADTSKLYQITKEFITAVVKSQKGNADKNI